MPLYYRLFLVFRGKIVEGEYKTGDYLPSEREVSNTFQVSRITAVRALNELAAAGLVVREAGRGTRVRYVSQGLVIRGASSGSGEGPPSAADPIAIRMVEFAEIETPAPVAQALHLGPGGLVQRAVRILSSEGEPFAQLTSFVPAEIGRGWTREDLAARPLHRLLDDRGYPTLRAEETVTATAADVDIAEQLHVAPGAPLIKISRTSSSREERPVEYMVGLYRPDRYIYRASLTGPALPPRSRLLT